MPYSDYFALREGYHAVISKISIDDPKNRWQDTYPHETFVQLLNKTARMLERPDSDSRKPLWIHGVYGTGKSRVAWTLGEMLTCPAPELGNYFDEYAELKKEKELRQRLLGLKNSGKIVVAKRYSSGEIQGLDQLVIAIYQSVAEALEKKGLNPVAEKSLAEGIVSWLEDEVNQEMLTPILRSEPYRHESHLPDTGAAVREMLLLPGCHTSLLGSLMRIARERHIIPISFNIDSLTAWLEEVIEINQLKALVFIWDEFSDFVLNNRNIFGEFQKLAEVSGKIPFYLILVTHFLNNLFAENDPAARVMRDRFKEQLIHLPDYTAYKLIGHALKVRPGMEEEWGEFADDLNNRLEQARMDVTRFVPGLDAQDFKKIIPIHPYAALILKNVAQIYDSNQRSMFDFIAVEDDSKKAFQYFIHNYGPEDAQILSIDHLWDYFYLTGQGKLGTGRENLDARVRTILDAYPLIANKYSGHTDADGKPADSPEQRVLKTIIILQALRASSPHTAAFAATDENLSTAFYGIPELSDGKGLALADSLVQEHELFIDQGIYQVPIGNAVDQTDIRKEEEKLRKSLNTMNMVGNFDVWNILPPNAALSTRLNIRKLTVRDFKRDLGRLANEASKSWAPKIAMLFARDVAEADAIRQYLQEALQEPRYNNILFIDAAYETMPKNKLDDYINASARQAYFTNKDKAQADRERDIAEKTLRDWESNISRGKFSLHSANFQTRHSPTAEDLVERLKSIIRDKYPACCDFLDGVKDPHFKSATGPTVISAGIKATNWNTITNTCVEQLLGGIKMDNYWELVPEHPLSKLKRKLEDKARRAFAPGGTGRLEVLEIVQDFMLRGFMPVSLYAYLSGYLMREYSSPEYRHSDGETGGVMTADRLASMLDAAFKKIANPDSKYREQYIEVLTREQRAFAEMAARLFNLDGNAGLERIASRLQDIIKNWGYPLWALDYLPEAANMREIVTLFTQYPFPEQHGKSSYGDIATDIGRTILKDKNIEDELKGLLTQDKLIEGMRLWLDAHRDGALPLLAREIGAEDYLRDVRECFGGNGAWLWNRGTCEDEVDKLIRGYSLAAESVRKGFLTQASSLSACLEGWGQKLGQVHLPAAILRERYPDQKHLLKIFEDLARGKTINDIQLDNLYTSIKDKAEILNDIFANTYNVFKSQFAEILKTFSEKDINALYARLPASSFRDDRDAFENELKIRAKELADRLKRGRLAQMWQEKTGTSTPEELSSLLRTPLNAILMELLDNKMCGDAIQACGVVGNSNASDQAIEQASIFFNTHEDLLKSLNDPALAEKAFKNKIINKCAPILEDTELARERLVGKLGDKIHHWLDNPNWQNVVMSLANEEYKKHGREAVIKKVSAMAPDDAKSILRKLGEDNFEVGLQILSE